MATTALIQARVEPKLKASSEKLLNSFGLDFSTAIRIYLNKIVQTQSIPFPIGIAPAKTEVCKSEADYITTPEEDAYDLKCAEEAYKEYVKSGHKSTPIEDLFKKYGV
jgi:addiction module RelB/DinJ family antitoxin